MLRLIWCLKWRWNNRNWRSTRQKKKAMRREFAKEFKNIKPSYAYTVCGL